MTNMKSFNHGETRSFHGVTLAVNSETGFKFNNGFYSVKLRANSVLLRGYIEIK
jgi:hypothetical protein